MSDNNKDLEPKTPGTNTKTGPGAEGIDPSAPNTGTSNWGGTTDERREIDTRNSDSGPDAKGAGDVRHTSYPQNEAAQNPAAEEESEVPERPKSRRVGRIELVPHFCP